MNNLGHNISGNCFKKTFKGTAQNENLYVLGRAILFSEVREEISKGCTIENSSADEEIRVQRLSGNITFKDGNGNTQGDGSYLVFTSSKKCYLNTETVSSKLYVESKYLVSSISGSRLGGDLNSLTGMVSLTKLYLSKCSFNKGNINNLKDATELTQLTVCGANGYSADNVFGDIADISTLIKLTTLDFSYTNVGGSVESFVEGCVTNGRNDDDTLTLTATKSNITFHNLSASVLKIIFNANSTVNV